MLFTDYSCNIHNNTTGVEGEREGSAAVKRQPRHVRYWRRRHFLVFTRPMVISAASARVLGVFIRYVFLFAILPFDIRVSDILFHPTFSNYIVSVQTG